MEKKILPYIIVISALSVSISAIFYSVTGLGKMFAGASLEVMIAGVTLEIGKLVVVALLYNYWKTIPHLLKGYFIIAVFVLMAITSGGIYGYLSAAYADTKNKVELMDKDFAVLDTKRDNFSEKLVSYRTEKESINENIGELTKALSNNVIQYTDKETGQLITTTSSKNRKLYEERLTKSEERRDLLSNNITAMTDSIAVIDISKITKEAESGIAGEIGPLKYIAELTGKTMDQVVNWFIIALISVFDPLAVALVLGANIVFAERRKEKGKLNLAKTIDDRIKEFEDREAEFKAEESKFNDRLKVIEDGEKEFINREKEFQLKLEEKEKSSDEALDKKLKELDSEIESAKEEVKKLDSEMKNSNDDLSRTLREEKVRVQNMEYELTEERAKVKEAQDKAKKVLTDLDKERLEIEKDRQKIKSDLENFNTSKKQHEAKIKEMEEWKKVNWQNRPQTPRQGRARR